MTSLLLKKYTVNGDRFEAYSFDTIDSIKERYAASIEIPPERCIVTEYVEGGSASITVIDDISLRLNRW